MKLKLPMLLGLAAAAAHILSNLLSLVNWFVEGYGFPTLNAPFLSWPITFVVELIATLAFVFLYRNQKVRYLALGVFVFSRIAYGLYWMSLTKTPISFALKNIIGWPYSGSGALIFFSGVFNLLTTLLIVAAAVTSLMNTPSADEVTQNNLSTFVSQSVEQKTLKQTSNTLSQIENVEALGGLLAKGLLTQEEFDRKKKQILGLD